jgi:hypothetical protein
MERETAEAMITQPQAETAIAVARRGKARGTKSAGNQTISQHRNGKETAILCPGEAGPAIAAKVTKLQVWILEAQQRQGRRLIQTRRPGLEEQAVQTCQDDNAEK